MASTIAFCYNEPMARLFGFDYKSPYFYMVTLKRIKGLEAFSQIGPDGLIENDLTRAFAAVIKTFHKKWRCLDEISPFVIMPDHLHLLIKIKPVDERKSLSTLVWQLSRDLSREYWRITKGRSPSSQNPPAQGLASGRCVGHLGATDPIFEKDWHDWIVKKTGQLAAFRRYIKENPARAWARRINTRYFQSVREVEFLGRKWYGYGNLAILNAPVLHAFKGHRATAIDSKEATAIFAEAARIGPGGAGVSTFMTPLEKAIGNAIAKAGGTFIVLSPEGFGARWHPPRNKEKFCAQGRMLFLSLYPADTRQPTKKELYARCHEMVDLATLELPSSEA